MLSSRAETLKAILETLADHQRTAANPVCESIRPTVTGESSVLPSSELLGGRSVRELLQFKSVLGEGGMGTVHLAEQRTVGRMVAVKQLRSELRGDAEQTRALLREGWVLAALEHPNIPPVHDVIVDDDGAPVLLLKRIEGESWLQLMNDNAAQRKQYGDERLAWNLDVLDSVCRAVSYAHSKGIVHRDLKPDNVMIGAFGEVYVLDWGLAASLERDPSGRLPFLGDCVQPAGTPCYMAPEQLDVDTARVGVATDIYLLGGLLYEVLCGTPPHAGTTMAEVVSSILKSAPGFSESAPTGLVEVCRKALHPDGASRYASVEEMRLAIRDYMRRRTTELLIDGAEERLDRMRKESDLDRSEARDATMARLYNECCFGFRQARAMSPESERAREGLSDAALLMARCALADGRPQAARTYLAEVEEPDQAILDEISELDARARLRLERLEAHERHHDDAIGRGKRAALAGGFAAAVTGGAIASELSRNTALDTHEVLVGYQVLLLIGFLVVYPRFRLEKTEHNRLAKLLITVALSGEIIVTGAAWAAGFSTVQALLLDSVVWMSASVGAALMMGFYYLPLAAVGVGATVTIALWPDLVHWTYPALCYVMLLNAGALHVFGVVPRSRLR